MTTTDSVQTSQSATEARVCTRPLLDTLSLIVVSGVVVALAIALIETLIVALRAGASLPATLLLSFSLYPPLGLIIGFALGLAAGGIRAVVWPKGSIWSHLREHPEADRAVGRGLLAGAVCVAIEAALVTLFAGGVASTMANPTLSALSTGLAAGAGVVLCVLVFFPVFHLLRVPIQWLPRLGTTTLTVVAFLAMVTFAAGAAVLSTLDWRMLRFGPWGTLAGMVIATALLGWIVARRGGRWRGLPVMGLAALIAIGLGASAPLAGRSEGVVSAAIQEGVLLPTLVGVGRRLGDRDGDGFSAWFSGGDCDDGNAGIHPGAKEIPGNGIDENCVAGDARPHGRRRQRPVAPTVKTPTFDGNVLLICVDTLRADKLGAMGHGGGLTPSLDRLASEGVLFTKVIAQGSNTPQSFPSTFTSQYPPRVPVRRRFAGYPALTPEALTFFEALSEHGVLTAAVTSHFYFKPKRGITQGVPDWDNRGATNLKDSNKDIASPRIVPRAITRLKELAAEKKRFVIFVHLFEPHSTYVKHRQFPITERGVKGLQQKYDFEIKFSDIWVGKLLQGLKEAGLEQRTAVIAYSDHGEAFGEHRFYFHGQALYNEVLHVPLIVRLPGVKPRKVHERVALLDLAPTILDLMGAPIPDSFQGRSLVPTIHGGKAEERRIGAVLMPYPAWPKGQQTMIKGSHKAIFRVTENRFEVYDLQQDPREQHNLALKRPELARTLKRELVRFVEEEMQ